MDEYLSDDSERAGEIITYLTRMQFLSPSEKNLLLKNVPYKGLVKRLLTLAFNNEIFRGFSDLSEVCKTKTTTLTGADKRLVDFISLHEQFSRDEISVKKLVRGLCKILKKLHIREFAFYEDLIKGGTCYLDFITFKKAFLKKEELKSYVRFMQPKAASPKQAWGGKRYIVQPNYQGIQLKIVLREDKNPKLFGRDQYNYASRMKSTLNKAQAFLEETGESRMEFDAILLTKDLQGRPALTWKAKDHVLMVYDYVSKSMPLKKRLKVVSRFCDYMADCGNKKIKMMPTVQVTGTSVQAEAMKYSKASMPYCRRNGVVVKVWDSPYESKRSASWLTYLPAKNINCGEFFGRGTLVTIMPSRLRAIVLDNNNQEVEIAIPQEQFSYLGRYMGYTVEYAIISEDYKPFRRVLYDKGREV